MVRSPLSPWPVWWESDCAGSRGDFDVCSHDCPSRFLNCKVCECAASPLSYLNLETALMSLDKHCYILRES